MLPSLPLRKNSRRQVISSFTVLSSTGMRYSQGALSDTVYSPGDQRRRAAADLSTAVAPQVITQTRGAPPGLLAAPHSGKSRCRAADTPRLVLQGHKNLAALGDLAHIALDRHATVTRCNTLKPLSKRCAHTRLSSKLWVQSTLRCLVRIRLAMRPKHQIWALQEDLQVDIQHNRVDQSS